MKHKKLFIILFSICILFFFLPNTSHAEQNAPDEDALDPETTEQVEDEENTSTILEDSEPSTEEADSDEPEEDMIIEEIDSDEEQTTPEEELKEGATQPKEEEEEEEELGDDRLNEDAATEDAEEGPADEKDEIEEKEKGATSNTEEPKEKVAKTTLLAQPTSKKMTSFQQGDKHKDIIDLKAKLKKLGFGGMNLNGTFGSFTSTRVRQFQEYYGLSISGKLDHNTISKLNEITSSPFQTGKKHNNVISLKEKLIFLGYGGMNLNATFGSFTEKRVKQFQSDQRLKAHGIADYITLDELKAVHTTSFKEGGRHKAVISFKKDLKKLGFGGMNLNETYGSFTAKRVTDLQKYYDLPTNGIADIKTLQKISKILSTTLQQGKKHKDVISVKNKLKKLQFGGMNINETFGSFTATRVKQFQNYYGLVPNGIGDNPTLVKLDEILNSPFQEGNKHNDVITIKEKLILLGYGGMNVNGTYGDFTEKRIKEFQNDNQLKAHGITDPITLNELENVLTHAFKVGGKNKAVISLKEKLKRLGFGGMNINQTYGSYTAKRMGDFQTYYGLNNTGVGDTKTLTKINQVINSPLQLGKRNSKLTALKTRLNEIGYGKISVTTLFGDFTEKKVKEFQRDKGLAVSGIIDEITEKAIQNTQARKLKVFIDAGHGGKDPGASGFGLSEKDLTLDIAKRLGKYLSNYSGIEIRHSRTTDTFLTLDERTKMANDWGADFFISVHINSCCGATGFESYIHNGKQGTQDAKDKQNIIHDQIVQDVNIGNDRGKKASDFHILRESKMSAILLEYLFIDTKSDHDKLKQASYRDQLAKATAKGIAKAFSIIK